MREKRLPIGKTRVQRYANVTVTIHVVGYNEKSGHNIWEEKCRRWENNNPNRAALITPFEDSHQYHRQLVEQAERTNKG